MNKLALIAVSAALAIAAAAQSRIAEAATLRTDTTISGDTVRLGDLFDDVMGKEDQPVGRAPARAAAPSMTRPTCPASRRTTRSPGGRAASSTGRP